MFIPSGVGFVERIGLGLIREDGERVPVGEGAALVFAADPHGLHFKPAGALEYPDVSRCRLSYCLGLGGH